MKIPVEAWTTSKTIVACDHCEGSGVREYKELVCYHKGDYDVWKEHCSFCDGEGRIIQLTYKTALEITLPNTKREYKAIEYTGMERLNGRKTSDFYEIGRK